MDINIHIDGNQDIWEVLEAIESYERIKQLRQIPPACRNCPNHPINGGSGICHCTLGMPQITC